MATANQRPRPSEACPTTLGAVKEKMGSSSVLGISFFKEINYQLSPL